MGSGKIFPVDETKLSIPPFKIPEYWFVINGMDFGWNHPQAHVQLIWDRDNDTYYVTNAWKGSETQPYEAWHIVKPWSDGVPVAWPHDGLQTEKGSAKQQMQYYAEEGFLMLNDHSTWPDGGYGIWPAITDIIRLMQTGKFFIFSNLFYLFEEIREYHTKTTANGNVEIVAKKNDLLDALFKAYMMRRHAIRICDINQKMVVESYNSVNPGMYDNF